MWCGSLGNGTIEKSIHFVTVTYFRSRSIIVGVTGISGIPEEMPFILNLLCLLIEFAKAFWILRCLGANEIGRWSTGGSIRPPSIQFPVLLFRVNQALDEPWWHVNQLSNWPCLWGESVNHQINDDSEKWSRGGLLQPLLCLFQSSIYRYEEVLSSLSTTVFKWIRAMTFMTMWNWSN